MDGYLPGLLLESKQLFFILFYFFLIILASALPN